jgi:glycogen synthase
MKVLLYSPAYLPRVGGLELYTAHLADGLASAGQQVAVVTETPGTGDDSHSHPYPVIRQPSPIALLRWARWCDVYFQANVSLRGLWPLLLVRRPWVVSHHSWYCRTDGRVAWQDRLKRRLLRNASGSIAVSSAIAADLGSPSTVIENSYRDQLFRRLPDVARDTDLLFVGRLVSDKGVDLLLDALAALRSWSLRPRLTVVGDGPERPALLAQAARLGLADQVDLVGVRRDQELVELMNRHRILVVPSRYREPFGIVALEGIACGCVVVGSAGGGLAEAIGPCGFTYPNEDTAALADALRMALALDETGRRERLAGAEEHLARHSTSSVIARHLEILERAVAGETSRRGLTLRGRA